ncbi:MAG: CotH kinase family protein [Oscillospiraceae bacterium]|nr:CotH kinase family protein [Oscillospiraceae bacterium]
MVMNKMKLCAAMTAGILLSTGIPVSAAAEDVKMSAVSLRGDADLNENVGVTDVVKLSRYLLQADSKVSINADLTGEGTIDAFDLALLKAMLLGNYTPEDFTGLVINEVCASNQKCWSDADGREPDWVEIHNSGKTDVNLSGYGLADGKKNLFKYVFPEGTVIPAGGYLMVCCDDGLTSIDPAEHHAPFKLSASGETLYLTHPVYGTLDVVEVPAAKTDITFGRYENAVGGFSSLTPTPGASNSTAERVVIVDAPVFSAESGFYDAEFQLDVTAAEGCTLYYTTDGTDPRTSAAAKLYDGAIRIYNNTSDPNKYSSGYDITLSSDANPSFNVDKGQMIRAVCKDAEGNFSDVVTKSYFVGKTAAYYQDMKVVSIVTDPANLFDDDKGIYVVGNTYYEWRNSPQFDPTLEEWAVDNPTNYNQSGKEWERPAEVQVFEQGALAYEGSVGIRIAGNATRSHQQKSIRLYARSEYGSSKMKYEFFEGLTDASGNPITEFDKVTIRNHGNDVNDACMRDEIVQDLAANMDLAVQAGEQCILFIDGEFWGFYSLKERLEDHYVESHYGIDKDNVTTIKNGEVEGDAAVGQSYADFYEWAMAADMTDPANYQRACDTIDMQSLMDYITLETYVCNYDWCNSEWTNNWQMWRANTAVEGNAYGDGKWRFMVYDTEYSAGLYGDAGTQFTYDQLGNLNRQKNWTNLGMLFYKLMENESFRTAFAENYRWHVENTFDYETNVKPLIDRYASTQKEAACITWKRFLGSWGDRLASNYDASVQTVHQFYQNRGRYALQYLDALLGEDISVPDGSEIVAEKDLWKLYIDNSGGFGTMTANDTNDLTVVTTEVGTNHWCVQAQYSPVTVQAGKRYQLTYTLRSDGNGKVAAFLQRNAEPYDTFTFQQHSVGTSEQTYTQTFTAKEDCTFMKLGFDCGYNTGTFYITDLSLICLG